MCIVSTCGLQTDSLPNVYYCANQVTALGRLQVYAVGTYYRTSLQSKICSGVRQPLHFVRQEGKAITGSLDAVKLGQQSLQAGQELTNSKQIFKQTKKIIRGMLTTL